MSRFIISGFSDEISSDTTVQFETLNRLGVKYFEPRGIDGKNISSLDDDGVLELKAKMEKYGILVSSIGSPIGKIQITDDFEKHLQLLKRVIKTAKMLDVKYIRIFSFFIPDGEYEKYRDEVIRRMKAMVAIAEEEGVILLHENEKEIYGDVASRCLEILEEVNSPNLRCVFDPANFVQCGQKTYPDAYEMLKPYIEYMHIKDALADGKVVPAGMGIGNVEEIITELYNDGYNGFLSLEPHLGNFMGFEKLEKRNEIRSVEKNLEEKYTLAYNALVKIIEKVEQV